jgi:hypothetical protein
LLLPWRLQSGTPLILACLAANHPTGTSYNLSTFTYGVTFGSGDSDQLTLDQYTGRMTTYTYNVNGKADTGQMTWNANGSLQKLGITDNITGTSDTQTCSYTHD